MSSPPSTSSSALAAGMARGAGVFLVFGVLLHAFLGLFGLMGWLRPPPMMLSAMTEENFIPTYSGSLYSFLTVMWVLEVVTTVAWVVFAIQQGFETAGLTLPPRVLRTVLLNGPDSPVRLMTQARNLLAGQRAGTEANPWIRIWWWLLRASQVLFVGWLLLRKHPAIVPHFRWHFLAQMVLGGGAFLCECATALFMSGVDGKIRELRTLQTLQGGLEVAAQRRSQLESRRDRSEAHPGNSGRAAPTDAPELACACCGTPTPAARCSECGAALRAGAFRVRSQLGQSSHARTYLATDATGAQVVLKELTFAAAPGAGTIDAFEREAALLAGLQDDRIPRFVGFFKESTGNALRLYLAYEYVEGQSLLEALAGGPFSEAEVIETVGALLRILGFLHARSPRVIHRDIKPSNVIRRKDGVIMLIDFGAAREFERTMTDSTLVGTFGYMSPQQLAGQIDETTDLYSVGATALHLVTGRPPSELMNEDLQIVIPHQIPISNGMARFLLQLVSRQRDRRFQSTQSALRAFGEATYSTGRTGSR